MAELYFDETSLSRAVQFIIDTGTANAFGEVLAQGFGERLEQVLRNLARDAAQAAPTRDQLAAMAMQALLSRGDWFWDREEPGAAAPMRSTIARNAYRVADAMLAERANGSDRG